ncbi:MAG: beta-galactosidase [Armatimonadota bacterium]|nr:MAG: beta-galactosidase [Armatimonadota bacterium]
MNARLPTLIALLLVCAATHSPAAVEWWGEAEGLYGWTSATLDGASGGLAAVGNANSTPGLIELPLPTYGPWNIWLRHNTGQQGSRRARVTVRDDTSVVLGGEGGLSWRWAKVASVAERTLTLQIKPLDPWPADFWFDCWLVTDDLDYVPPDELPAPGRFGEATYRPPFIPSVLVVGSHWELSGYIAATEWDEALARLRWPLAHCSTAELVSGDVALDEYDVVLFTAAFNRRPQLNLSPAASALRRYVSGGGLVIVTDLTRPEQTHWLAPLGVTVREGGDGRPADRQVESALTHPWTIFPRYSDRPWTYCRHPNGWGAVPSYVLSPREGDAILAVGRRGAPLAVSRRLGRGTLAAAVLCKDLGLDHRAVFNLWLHHYAQRSDSTASALGNLKRFCGASAEGPKPYTQWPKVGRGAKGQFLWRGKPFFPVGLYLVNQANLRLVAEAGFNAVMGGGGGDYLAQAARHDVAVFASCSWDMDELARAAHAQRESRSLAAYYVMDEPSNSGHTIEQLHEMIDTIKRQDPDTPCFFIDNDPNEFPSCLPLVDVAVLDPYELREPRGDIRTQGVTMDYARRLLDDDAPLLAVLQAHGFAGEQPILAKPTPQQLRAETYLALAHGARGIFYFVFDQNDDSSITFLHRRDGSFDEPLWSEAKRLARELTRLAPVLSAATFEGALPAGDAEAGWWRGEADLVVLVNTGPDVLTGEVVLPFQPAELTCTGEGRVRVRERLRYVLGPWETAVAINERGDDRGAGRPAGAVSPPRPGE